MTYDGLPHVSLLSYPEIRDRVILLDGWSKTYAMTGWRMGFSVWPKPLYSNIRKLAVNAWSCVNAPAQYAGLAALTGPQDSVAAMVAEFDKRRKIVVEELNKLARLLLHHAEGRVLRLPQHHEDRLQGEGARLRASRGSQASPPSAAPTSASSAKAIMRLSYANSAENIRKAIGTDRRVPGPQHLAAGLTSRDEGEDVAANRRLRRLVEALFASASIVPRWPTPG